MAGILSCSKNKKLGTAGFFFHWNCSNKVLLGISSTEYAKIKHDGGFNLFKMLKKDLAVVLFCEDAKIRYGWVFLQMEMLKYGTAEVFFH